MLETSFPTGESTAVAERDLPSMGHYARVTLTVVAVLAILAAAWAVRATLMLVLVAAVLAVGLDPPRPAAPKAAYLPRLGGDAHLPRDRGVPLRLRAPGDSAPCSGGSPARL